MTVQNVLSSTTFVGTGAVTSFTFNFRADDIAWLTLSYLTNFDQIILNGNQDDAPGGSVEYFVAPPVDQQIQLTRNVPLTQLLDYERYDPFDSESHEDALDKLTMAIQDRDRNTSLKSKSATIETPSISDKIVLFYTPVEITITEIMNLSIGTFPTITYFLNYGDDFSQFGTQIVIGGITNVDEDFGDLVTVLDNPVVPAGSFVWFDTFAIGAGSVLQQHLTIRYREELP